MSTVENFNRWEDNLSSIALKDIFRFGDNLSTLEVPILTPIASMFAFVLHLPVFEFLFNLGKVHFYTHFGKESVNELFERTTSELLLAIFSMGTVMTASATATSTTSAAVPWTLILRFG